MAKAVPVFRANSTFRPDGAFKSLERRLRRVQIEIDRFRVPPHAAREGFKRLGSSAFGHVGPCYGSDSAFFARSRRGTGVKNFIEDGLSRHVPAVPTDKVRKRRSAGWVGIKK